MLGLLENWKGTVLYNGQEYSVRNVPAIADGQPFHITLKSAIKKSETASVDGIENSVQYRVTVKRYMTEPASPGFDFMAKWNNNKPMPLCTMVGEEIKETKGMVYMKLHGQAEPVVRCMRCGRLLTNPVSQHYGIGPECMSKLGLACDITDVETIKKKLVDVTWEGWIIKSSIVAKEKEVVT